MKIKSLLRSESDKHEFMILVAQTLREVNVSGSPFLAECEVKKHRIKRSLKQNALLWAIHTRVAAEIFMRTLKQFSPEDIHNYVFKPMFCGVEEIEINGHKKIIPLSSTLLNTAEFSAAIEKYIAMLAVDYGIIVDINDIMSNEYSGNSGTLNEVSNV